MSSWRPSHSLRSPPNPHEIGDRPITGDMKVIVVSGARSKVGKTHLTRALSTVLPGSVRIKIGHHPWKEGGDINLYREGTSFSTIAADHGKASFLIVESNRILSEITPDLTIYLPAENPKPSAELALAKADIIRGEPVPASKISDLAVRLGCSDALMKSIVELAGGVIES